MLSKTEYFDRLYALNESSDDEVDASDASASLSNGDRPLVSVSVSVSSLPISSSQARQRRSPKSPRQPPPAMHRNNSAPQPSVSVKPINPLTRKTSLLRYDTSTPPTEYSFSGKTSSVLPSSSQRPNPERRVVSDPTGGSLVLKNSTGIASMLQKNQKRKREAIKLVPEDQQIFRGLDFFYLPAGDSKDCIAFRRILNAKQDKYAVKGAVTASEEKAASQRSLQAAQDEEDIQRRTPPREDSASQARDTDGERGTQEISQNPSPERNFQREMGFNDPLAEMIEYVHSKKHLPLDDEENEERPSSSDSMQDPGHSDDSRERSPSPVRKSSRKKRKGPKGAFDQNNFSCMTGGTGETTSSNPNARTIEVLQEMGDFYEQVKDQWRTRAYRMAIGTLKKTTDKIRTADEAEELPKIGKRIALKIEEIALTDGLRRLEFAKQDPTDRTRQIFLKIYGVGPSQGLKWAQQGYKTLEDLKAHVHLTANQKIGIAHYNDFDTRIPREEVTALGDIVKQVAAGIDPDVELTVGGSYRRGAATLGDIDFLITKPNTTTTIDLLTFLDDLVRHLTDTGFLVAALAVPRGESSSKWHGACVLPGNPIWRRIDFLLVPASQMGAALLYFTGDDIFNRSMRFLAGTKGWRLNQRGLYKDVMRGPGREKLSEGVLVEGADEKRIFRALGVPWRPPEQRICH
ncbi:DNA polymerase lambda [Lachnellula occidentalis]|uniref:DNA polymerase n=1 Tax=Lachnellula occidentalis TaxID=215460 RepID=A0A8H8RQJ4_9HELO|nr:DNA polymerase lambda [Lachnellula occidentalis]